MNFFSDFNSYYKNISLGKIIKKTKNTIDYLYKYIIENFE